jgi:hypothetical protein
MFSPTAKHVVAVGHATPRRSADVELLGFCAGVIDQLVWSQCSANGLRCVGPTDSSPPEKPTAWQSPGAGHAIALRLALPLGLGLGRIDHVVPFQRSTKVALTGSGLEKPTASHLVALEQVTPCNAANVDAAGLGLGVIDQLVPSNRSTNVFAPPSAAVY